MKVREMSGAVLDMWVAKAEGWEVDPLRPPNEYQIRIKSALAYSSDYLLSQDGFCYALCGVNKPYSYSPSTDWARGGPIIEREGFGICKFYEPTDGPIPEGGEWCALWRDDSMRADGPTPLVAGMRLVVMSKFGDEVSEP
jgi:hypothetical protein